MVGEMKHFADILDAVVGGLEKPAGFQHQMAVDIGCDSQMCNFLGDH